IEPTLCKLRMLSSTATNGNGFKARYQNLQQKGNRNEKSFSNCGFSSVASKAKMSFNMLSMQGLFFCCGSLFVTFNFKITWLRKLIAERTDGIWLRVVRRSGDFWRM
ncbi:MAG: hypothetical protein ACRENG_20405, partial [bacterium]